MRLLLVVFAAGFCLFVFPAWAGSEIPSTKISDPYIDLRTGPGRGYPIFYVAERGDFIEIIKRRTDWFQIKTPRGTLGWVHKRQLQKTLNLEGQQVVVSDPSFDDFSSRSGELGFMYGALEGASYLTVFGGYAFTENLSIEAELGKAIGDNSSAQAMNLSLLSQPFPEWYASPYVLLSIGQIEIEPKSSLVEPENVDDNTIGAGIGVKLHVSRQFIFRVEYKSTVILGNDNDNEEIEEWKAGLAVFF